MFILNRSYWNEKHNRLELLLTADDVIYIAAKAGKVLTYREAADWLRANENSIKDSIESAIKTSNMGVS